MSTMNYGIINETNEMPRRAGNTRGAATKGLVSMQNYDTPNNNLIPYGYCQCGCGEKTRVSPRTDRMYGYIKNEPRKYIRGHNGKTQPNKWEWDSSLGCFRVTLANEEYMLIDAQDEELVRQYHWCINTSRGKTGYIFHQSKHSDGSSRSIYLHRLLTNAPDDTVVDHINGEGRDNRRSNLRVCTNTENQRNRTGLSITSKTGYRGVCLPTKQRKWQASIGFEGRTVTLGTFHCPIEAAIARDVAALELHGEFASLNFPELREVFS